MNATKINESWNEMNMMISYSFKKKYSEEPEDRLPGTTERAGRRKGEVFMNDPYPLQRYLDIRFEEIHYDFEAPLGER